MPIEDRNLKPGTRLLARYYKQSYSCEVVEREDGKLRYRLEDGRELKSPSAAGTAITGKSCNGWSFWGVEMVNAALITPPTEDSPTDTQQEIEVAETTPEDTEQPDVARKGFFRTPNQKAVPENHTRWFCPDCGESFLVVTGETPENCPQGHKA